MTTTCLSNYKKIRIRHGKRLYYKKVEAFFSKSFSRFFFFFRGRRFFIDGDSIDVCYFCEKSSCCSDQDFEKCENFYNLYFEEIRKLSREMQMKQNEDFLIRYHPRFGLESIGKTEKKSKGGWVDIAFFSKKSGRWEEVGKS